MSLNRRPDESLPLELALLTPVCDRFEAAWKAGTRPRLEDYLLLVDASDPPALLRELLRLELDHRSRCGEHPTVEEYRLRLPEYVHFVHETFINHSSVGPEGPVLSTLCGAPSLPAASQMAPALEAPTSRAGRYELEAEIGHGGMGAAVA
jgi:eukaryotic-like serine/threonine-protein kinase